MESISELRKICQSPAKADRSNVYMLYVCRSLSIFITRWLIPTSVTANKVSFAMIVAGTLAALFFLSPSPLTFALGAILLQIWYLLDCVDGEVARYRHYQKTGSIVFDKKQAMLTGVYYDRINHYIVHFLVPVCMGFGTSQSGSLFPMLLGIAASLGQVLMLALHDARFRPMFNYLTVFDSLRILKSPPAQETKEKKRSLPHSAFMVLHYTMTYPTVMNLIGIAAILNFFTEGAAALYLLLYLAIGSLTVSITLITRFIAQKSLETEIFAKFSAPEMIRPS